MRLLFVADGRSPIAQNWIRYFVDRGDEVYLASTFALARDTDLALNGLEIIPVAFSGLRSGNQRPGTAPARTVGLRTTIRQWFGPLTIRRPAQRLHTFTQRVKPDLVHAMRIPYEGMMAADAYTGIPLIVSTWGNDFTLHAPATRLMNHYTRWTMKVADALHTDCQRDLRLARDWAFGRAKPYLVAPGNGGVRRDIFHPHIKTTEDLVIINPRGFRPYVNNEAFFKAIPLVLEREPQAQFIFALMAGEAQAVKWTREFGIENAVELLPPLSHFEMAEAYRRAQIVASPSLHDGTPNTLLEGMACGCLPIAGDIESIREWITPGENGLLFDPNDPRSIAKAIVAGIENKSLRQKAAGFNQEMISARAEYGQTMGRVEEFYGRVIK
jgi:glycosyltransferase involved in cell wall biosynthesis